MKIIFKIFGQVLQLMGLATMFFVIILFFGKTDMFMLLKMTLLGIFEFYGGYFLVRWASGLKN
jgi:hypothetical protein